MALNAYLKIEGITSRTNTPITIEISSFSWGVSRATSNSSGGGGGAGKTTVHEIVITKTTDSTSPTLLRACANGSHFGLVQIGVLVPAVQSNGAVEYWKYDFSDVLITHFDTGGNFGGSPQPTESIKFEFSDVAILLPAVQTGN